MKIEPHPFIHVINQSGVLVVKNKARRCVKCILPETFPQVDLSVDEICGYCRNAETLTFHEKEILDEVRVILANAENVSDYDCIALFSGGKDSSMALYTLKKEMNLRVLAFTLDNGFISETTFTNMSRICTVLEVDHILYRPAYAVMKKVYSVSLKKPFDEETTKYSTSSCGSCISIVLASAAKLAVEKKIPIMAGGWTPGQLTNDPILPGEFLNDVCARHFNSLASSAPNLEQELEKYNIRESLFPKLFNPLYCRNYDEQQIFQTLSSLGWNRPMDTDSCSTNCRLNGFLVMDHLYRYGYHPYEYELANHVRLRSITRDEALAKIENIEITLEQLNRISREFEIYYQMQD